MALLKDYAANVTSQNGEDGMIAKLITDLRLSAGKCVEFGAWDGRHLSNTWNLWARQGWEAVLIEADIDRYALLRTNTAPFPNVTAVHATIGNDPNTSLDQVLADLGNTTDIALLSVDIDGDDYYVWTSIQLRPSIVIIEYNASFPPEIRYIPPPGTHVGASAAAFLALAEEKDYELVGLTTTNLIFLRNDLVRHLTTELRPLSALFDRNWLPLVYSDMYGIHRLLRPAQWGYAGFRVETARSTLIRRLPHTFVTSVKWLADNDYPVISSLTRRIRTWYVTDSIKRGT